MIAQGLRFNLYTFYNDYETSYTTYINHAHWHRCLRSDGLYVGRNRNARRKPTCLTWWPHDHLTCRRRVWLLSVSIRFNCIFSRDWFTLWLFLFWVFLCRIFQTTSTT